jgi:hypothetical protein
MLNVIMLNVIMLNVIMLNVVMPSVVMLNVVMLNVIMPSVVMPIVVAPSVFALTTGLFDTGSDFSTRRAEIVARNRFFSSKLERRRRPNDLFHSTSRTQTSTKSLPPTPPI